MKTKRIFCSTLFLFLFVATFSQGDSQNLDDKETLKQSDGMPQVEGLYDYHPKDPCAPYYNYQKIEDIPEFVRQNLTDEQWVIVRNCLKPFDPPVRSPDDEL